MSKPDVFLGFAGLLLGIISLSLRMTVLPAIGWLTVTPEFHCALIVFYAAAFAPAAGLLFTLILGLIADALAPGFTGYAAISYMILHVAMAAAHRTINLDRLPAQALLAIGCQLLLATGRHLFLGPHPLLDFGAHFRMALASAIISGICALPLLLLLHSGLHFFRRRQFAAH
ncbi:MAG: rod shape-determining protein MreD [Deltaproteobacteria bacterium]|nr:rod shape-determining protein MreD [Candidatus Anaeroferrophillacea bacterium]